MPTEGEHLQLLTITFTPDTDSCLPDHDTQPFVVTFKAQWGAKITTGVFRFPLSPAQIRALLPLLQEYVDSARCKKLAQTESAQAALRALGIEPTTESASVEQLPTLMGIALFEALFHRDSHVKKLWDTFHDSATQHTTVEHRIVLHFIERQDCKASIPLLIALPWELLSSGEGEDPFFIDQNRIFTLVRTYQPPKLFQESRVDHEPTKERPFILLLETQDDKLNYPVKLVRPRELNKDDSLWCHTRNYRWKDPAHQLRTFKPQIIHIVAHGMRYQNRNWIVYGSEDDKNDNVIGPSKLRRDLREAESTTTFIVCFVCHSGVSNDSNVNNSQDVPPNPSQLGRSLLDALPNVAPALLLMQGLIRIVDAEIGSTALYREIADGKGVALATRELRLEIYYDKSEKLNEPHRKGTSWWIPTLYLRNPQAELCLVIPKPKQDDDTARKALTLPSDVLNVLDSVYDSPTLITLQCEPKGGKTVRLRRIADHLQSKGHKYILLPPIPTDKAEDDWFQKVLFDIATYVRAYRTTGFGISYTVFVLCDDGDRLSEEHWKQLFHAKIKARLIFITTTSEPLTINIPHVKHSSIELSPLTNEEFRALQRPSLEKFRKERPDTIDAQQFHKLEIMFFTSQIALSRDTLVGISDLDKIAFIIDDFLNHAISHQVAFYNPDDERYHPVVSIPSNHRVANKFFFKMIQDYITNPPSLNHTWPDDLLDIIIHQDYYKDINPVPYKDENALLWWRWLNIATQLSRDEKSDAFARIALYQSRQSPYNCYTIARDGLHYIILTRGKLIPPELYAGELCHILWPEQGRRIDPPSSDDLQNTSLNVILDVSDEQIETFIAKLEEEAHKHQKLLAVLRGRSGNADWRQHAYDAHREDIIKCIQQDYENNIQAKRCQTKDEFQKVRNRDYYLRSLNIDIAE